MTDARHWQPPSHDKVRALLPKTPVERYELAARIGVGQRLMRYWWSGGKTPKYLQWRELLRAVAEEKDDG